MEHEGGVLRQKLASEIETQGRLQDRCFKAYERFKWGALTTGVLSTILVAVLGGQAGAQWLAILPALTSFFIGTEQAFQFRARSGWHHDKRLALSRLLVRLDCGASVEEIGNDLIDLEEQLGSRFPHGSAPTIQKQS